MFDGIGALWGYLTTVPARDLCQDALVLMHLGALAVGLGWVVQADRRVVLALSKPLDPGLVRWLGEGHRWIGGALTALWISGAGILALRLTGGGEITPKLMAKLATVGLLTVTALGMGCIWMPLIRASVGLRILALPLRQKLGLALAAGLSAGGWGTALLLGGVSALADAPGPALVALLALSFGTPVTVLLGAALATHRPQRPLPIAAE